MNACSASPEGTCYINDVALESVTKENSKHDIAQLKASSIHFGGKRKVNISFTK